MFSRSSLIYRFSDLFTFTFSQVLNINMQVHNINMERPEESDVEETNLVYSKNLI